MDTQTVWLEWHSSGGRYLGAFRETAKRDAARLKWLLCRSRCNGKSLIRRALPTRYVGSARAASSNHLNRETKGTIWVSEL